MSWISLPNFPCKPLVGVCSGSSKGTNTWLGFDKDRILYSTLLTLCKNQDSQLADVELYKHPDDSEPFTTQKFAA